MVKAIAFDAYGTLFDVRSVISLCNELFPAFGESLSRQWRAKQLEYTWLLSLMGHYEDFWMVTEKALLYACDAFKLSCPPAARERLMNAYLTLEAYPDVAQTLRALKAAGLPLAILSNGSPKMLQAAVQNAGLSNTFGHIISVDAIRTYKPSPEVYQLGARALGLDPRTIGFVSSNGFDVEGAKSFGFWTCWVNRDGNPPERLGFAADLIVENPEDLVGRLVAGG